MKTNIDRLTLRNVNPILKQALQLRAKHLVSRKGKQGTSMEDAIIQLLTKELQSEIEAISKLDELLK